VQLPWLEYFKPFTQPTQFYTELHCTSCGGLVQKTNTGVFRSSRGPRLSDCTECHPTFPWCTVCVVWVAMGAREIHYEEILLVRQNSSKIKLLVRGDFTPFMSKSVQRWDHFFPLEVPKDSKNLKSLNIGLLEMGAKRPLNRVRKCDKQTKRHTQTLIRTFWLIERIGSERRFFESA
jgi:hypothetical protein